MYLPRDFPPRAESHRGLRLRSGIRTPKGMAPCRCTTDGFAVLSAAAWDVLWNRSPTPSGGKHAQRRAAGTDPSLVLRRTLESRHHRAATRCAPGHRPPRTGDRTVQPYQGSPPLADGPLRRVHSPDFTAVSPAACHAHLPDDSGTRLHRKCGAVAACGSSSAARSPGVLLATPLLSGRAGASRLGALWRSPRWTGPSASVLLSDHPFLLACSASGILLRSKYGKLSARSCSCVSSLVGTTTNPSLRQPPQCRAGTSRRPDSLSSSTVGLVLALSLRPSSLSGTSRKSKRTRGTSSSLCARVILGRTMILAPCSKLSPKNSHACFLYPHIRSRPTWFSPSTWARPSTYALI